MAIRKGYIKFPRSIFSSKQWRKERTYSEFEVVAYLYAKAAFVDGLEVNVEGKLFRLQRGQLITSIRNLAEDWHWSKSGVQRLLSDINNKSRDNLWDNFSDNLWDNLQIKIESLPKTRYTLITICNYDNYDVAGSVCDNSQTVTFGDDVGTTCGTTCGTSNNKEVITGDTSTHTKDILAKYKQSCASADMRQQAFESCKELSRLGYFGSREAKAESDAFWLITYIYRNFSSLQFKMERPLITREAELVIQSFGSTPNDLDDMARVLDAMANRKGLHNHNRSVYYTLCKWLREDSIRKKRLEDEKARKHNSGR